VNALVTGAAGFIGSHLTRRLLEAGHTVTGFDDLSAGAVSNLAGVDAPLIEGDLRDADAARRAADGCDVIFHQAAMKSVPRSIAEPLAFADVNVVGTLHVLEAARAAGAAVVFASSSSVYGDQDRYPVAESMTPRPRSPYAASKLAGEAYCRAWWEGYGVPTVALRYLNVYGPGQDPASEYASVIPRFIRACLDGTRPVIHGDGEQARDFTYVDDVVEANLLAARMPEGAGGEVFNVGGGRTPTSINELLAIVASEAGAQPGPLREPPRAGDIRVSHADVTKARDVLGYAPAVDIREGLRRTVSWFRTRPGA
jgi:UDP-N-acetylglucosamine/UDP-N-acetyl-alpha-D-glucosaminouronate 4-epimerase